MGVKGLTAALSRFRQPAPLSGDSVVIDGPALVFRLLTGCLIHRKKGGKFVCQPPYALFGSIVIEWLDAIRRSNVTVRKIYFDGYLPPSKWPVRLERLADQSKNINGRFIDALGVAKPPPDAFDYLGSEPFLLSKNWGHSWTDSTPKPPFLVPSIIEILKSHRFWGPLTQVVPGEADVFCAEDVREHGGVVLTSDSDLLMQDLGPNGAVSFFWDINSVSTSAGPFLSTHKLIPRQINHKLEITENGGIPRVAFERVVGHHGWDEAIRKVQKGEFDDAKLAEFSSFLDDQQMKHFLPKNHKALEILSSLDPRVAELVIQSLTMEGAGLIPSDKTSRGPESLSMFLPIIVEDRTRKSAWTMSTTIRQMAYSLLQIAANHRSAHIVEYRKFEPSSGRGGRQVDVPDEHETTGLCRDLAGVLQKLKQYISVPEQRWFALAIYQDIAWAKSEERQPLSIDMMQEALEGSQSAEEYSWDLLHLVAQIQASYYSVRMAKQILGVFAHLQPGLPKEISRLHEYLNALPPIAKWPTTDNITDLLTQLGSGGLKTITSMLGMPVDLLAPLTSKPHKPKPQRVVKPSKSGPPKKRSPGLNPYALLSEE